MDFFDISGKVIIVTGGQGFLGTQFVNHLVSAGAIVKIFDNKGENQVDITNQEHVHQSVKNVLDEYGAIDGLVHAAAIDSVPGRNDSNDRFSPYESYPMDLWRQSFEVNVHAAQIVTEAVAPVMMKQRSGSIIFVASDLGIIAPNNTIYEEGKFKDLAYTTSKASTIGLSRNWASYLGPYNVRVNALSPGGVYNNQPQEFVTKNVKLNMLGRMANKEEYNGAIQFLLSSASSYMTGSNLVIDAGRTAW